MEGLFIAEDAVSWEGTGILECDVQHLLTLVGAIGSGGFGSVYRVNSLEGGSFGSQVLALKRSNVGFSAEGLEYPFDIDGRSARAMLRRAFLLEWNEYRQAAGADGHVPRPHAFGVLLDTNAQLAYYAILMDWVEGLGLEEAASVASSDGSGRLSVEQTMEWGILLCDALWSLHRRNVVHRDLYAANIKVRMTAGRRDAEFMTLIDLGQSASPADIVTPSGGMQRLAQLHFGAPEMFLTPGEPFYDDRNDTSVDVWSLGALLYHLRTGKMPHSSLDRYARLGYLEPKDARQIAAIKQAGISLGDACCESGDEVLERVIRNCTQPVPVYRPNVKAVGRILREALDALRKQETIGGAAPEQSRGEEVFNTPTPEAGHASPKEMASDQTVTPTPVPGGVKTHPTEEKTPPSASDGPGSEASDNAKDPIADPHIPAFLNDTQRMEYREALAAEGVERALRAAEYYALESSPNAHAVAAAFRKIAADRGHPTSCVAYGHALFYGIDGTISNPVDAFVYLRRGLEAGVTGDVCARACLDLGRAYRYGLGTPRSFTDALRMFTRATDLGRADATFELALMYYEGAGVREDDKKVLALMREAARGGSQQAFDWLVRHGQTIFPLSGDEGEREPSTPHGDEGEREPSTPHGDEDEVPPFFTADQYAEYKAVLASQEADRAVRAADFYARNAPKKENRVSIEFRRIAADRGHAPSCVAYGHARMHGLYGVEADPRNAVSYLKRGVDGQLCKRALALGTFDLGIAYRYGLGVPRMFSEALDLFGRSSAQGNPDAGYELALMYQDGAGVRSSAEKALELMREAAKEGSRQAIAWLETHDLSTKKQRRIPRPLMVVIVLVVLLIILTLV
ncbi:MAG: SEL1-like repeat protein [Atopobiaceae bacterium]|nr:SEL1-like repeat protein [Atopobiaceae bacterium]